MLLFIRKIPRIQHQSVLSKLLSNGGLGTGCLVLNLQNYVADSFGDAWNDKKILFKTVLTRIFAGNA